MFSIRVIRKGLNNSILSQVFFAFFFTATSGAVLTGLFLHLKMSSFQIGVANAITTIFIPMQLAGTWLQRRYFERKRFWFFNITCGVVVWTAVVALLFIRPYLAGSMVILLFLVFLSLSQVSQQLAVSSWFSWMSDLVPRNKSMAFWSTRNRLGQVSMLVAALISGIIVDRFGRDADLSYIIVITTGVLMGLAHNIIHFRAPDPDPASGKKYRLDIRRELGRVWADRNFRRLIYFFGLQSFSIWFMIPFVFVHWQQGLSFSMTSIQIISALTILVSFFTAYPVRIISDKAGRKPLVIICTFLKVAELTCWIFLTPATVKFLLAPVILLSGIANMGLLVNQISLVTASEGEYDKSVLAALFFSIMGLLGFSASLISGYIYDWVGSLDLVTSLGLSAFSFTAFIAAAGHMVSLYFILSYTEHGSQGTVRIIRRLFSSNPFKSIYQAHVLSSPMEEEKKIRTLFRTRSGIVRNEIIASLYNSSTRIREEAIYSITRNREKYDPRVWKELIKVLEMPELGNQVPAAKALGHLKIQESLPVLLKYLGSGDNSLAQACIYAIGRIAVTGFKKSPVPKNVLLKELTSLLSSERHRLLWPALCEAIGKMGNYGQTRAVYPVFQKQELWILKRQCLIAVANLLIPGRGFLTILEKEEQNPGSVFEKNIRRLKKILKAEGSDTLVELRTAGGRSLSAFDREDYTGSISPLLVLTFQILYPSAQVRDDRSLEKRLNRFYNSAGHISHRPFLERSYRSTAWWTLISLYNHVRHSDDSLAHQAALIAGCLVCEMLENRKNPLF